jgi:hypothetical protein
LQYVPQLQVKEYTYIIIDSELADKIGKGKYTLTEYEKFKRITIPLEDKYLLYVTTEVEADLH